MGDPRGFLRFPGAGCEPGWRRLRSSGHGTTRDSAAVSTAPQRRAVVPVFLQVAEERRDGADIEVVEGELGRRDGPFVAEPGDQELERVALGRIRGGRAAAEPGQVGREEAAAIIVPGHDTPSPEQST